MKYLVFAGTAINLVLTFSYIKKVAQGAVQPNRVSWLMWSAAPMIAAAAEISRGVGLAALPVFMSGFTPLVVFIVSFFNKKAYWRLSAADYACGAVSLLALAVWALSKNPDYAILFAVLSDAFAAVPTVAKAWKHPQSESAAAYIGGLILSTSSFFAVQTLNFASLAFPVYLTALNVLILFAIWHKASKDE